MRGRGFFAKCSHGLASITANADAWVNLNFAQNRHPVGTRRLCAFSMTEDV